MIRPVFPLRCLERYPTTQVYPITFLSAVIRAVLKAKGNERRSVELIHTAKKAS